MGCVAAGFSLLVLRRKGIEIPTDFEESRLLADISKPNILVMAKITFLSPSTACGGFALYECQPGIDWNQKRF